MAGRRLRALPASTRAPRTASMKDRLTVNVVKRAVFGLTVLMAPSRFSTSDTKSLSQISSPTLCFPTDPRSGATFC